MKVIRPLKTLCDNIVSYNVPKDHEMWLATTTYNKGDEVAREDCGATIYRSAINNNIGIDPITDTDGNWVAVGTSNYFAMFDNKNTSQTVNPDEIVIEITFNGLVNAVALINVDADQAHFEAWEDDPNELLFEETIDLKDFGVTNLYDFYFSPVRYRSQVVKLGLPTMINGTGRLTLTKTNGDVKLGSLVYGDEFRIGQSTIDLDLDFKDYSEKTTNVFGDTEVIIRSYSNLNDYNVIVSNVDIDSVIRFRNTYRGIPLVWIADENKPYSINYGYFEKFRQTLSHIAYAECTISVQSLN